MMVREDLELRIQVKIEKDEAGKGSSRVAAGETLERVVDLIWVSRTDAPIVHDRIQSISHLDAVVG